MKPKMPTHCKDCTYFHNAGRNNPKGGLEKYNAWCCRNGQPANKSVGWCKTHGMKVPNV